MNAARGLLAFLLAAAGLVTAAPINASCLGDGTSLCLAGSRFAVEVVWDDGRGGSGAGQAIPLTSDTGAFWFFSDGNLELVVKVLDGRWLNGHWWVFAGALSNVAYTITVTDTASGAARSYDNPLGQLASFADTSAFNEGPGIAAAPSPAPDAIWGELLRDLLPQATQPSKAAVDRTADLAVSLVQSTCDPCEAGQRVILTTALTNLGPDPDPEVTLSGWYPRYGLSPFDASASQGQLSPPREILGPPPQWFWFLDVGPMQPGETVTMTSQVDLDMTAPPDPTFVINSPPSLAGPMVFIPAACPGRFAEWDETVDLEWVDDGSDRPTEGCGELQSFTPGNIALIDRGSCEFYGKALSAEAAGAVAAVIADDREEPIGDFPLDVCWSPPDIPVLGITQTDGNFLRQLILVDGETVNATVGHASPPGPWELEAEALGFGSEDADPDCPEWDEHCYETDNYAITSWTVNPAGCPTPAPPSDLRASATTVPPGMPYALLWGAPPEPVTFELEEANDPDFADATRVPVEGTTWLASHPEPGTLYYRVRSVAPCTSVSAWSEPVAVTVGGSSSCHAGPTALCLAGWRFQVEVVWEDGRGGSGVGQAVPLTPDTGAFWFFSDGNLELVVKVLDGRWFNGHWWVFGGALSDVAYTITVTDTASGAVRSYDNPLGTLASFADTSAFAEP